MNPALTRVRPHCNGRGHPLTVTLRRSTVLEPLLEGVALAEESAAFARRVETSALGWDLALHHAAVAQQARCAAYGAELRRLAGLVG